MIINAAASRVVILSIQHYYQIWKYLQKYMVYFISCNIRSVLLFACTRESKIITETEQHTNTTARRALNWKRKINVENWNWKRIVCSRVCLAVVLSGRVHIFFKHRCRLISKRFFRYLLLVSHLLCTIFIYTVVSYRNFLHIPSV